MKSKTLFSLLTSLGLFPVVQADWVLQENFEAGTTANWTLWNQQAMNPDVQGPANLGEFSIVADPFGDSTNNVVRLRAGDGLISDNAFRMTLPINPVIDEGQTGTLYLRFATQGSGINIALGLSSEETFTSVSDQRWAAFNALFRFGVPTQGKIQAYNTNGYLEASPNELAFATWYELWMVVNNRENVNAQGNFTGLDDTFELFIKGGPWAEQTQLLTPTGGTEWVIRNNPTLDPIRHFMMLPTTDSPDIFPGNDYFFVDDLYVSVGAANLGSPVSTEIPMWNGYPVNADGWADTGSFMGLVYVTNDPWIWVSDLSRYVYLPAVMESGAWINLFR
jgi:hypothetical protein